MEFRIEQNQFKDFITPVARIATASKLADSGLSLRVKGNKITASAAHTEIWVKSDLDVEGIEDGEVVVADPGLMARFVSRLDSGVIHIVTSEKLMNLKCGKTKAEFHLATHSVEPLPPIKNGIVWRIPQKVLRDLIRKTIFAVSQDDTRPQITGIHFTKDADKVLAVGTDAARLACASYASDVQEASFTLPASTAKELDGWLRDDENDVVITIGDRAIEVNVGHATLRCTLLQGEFPAFRSILQNGKAANYRFQVNTKEILSAIERASLLGKNRAAVVKLVFSPDGLQVLSEDAEVGKFQEEIAAIYESDIPDPIAVSSKFLLDGLKFADQESIQFEFDGNLRPIHVGLSDMTYIVMPVRISN